MDTPKYHINSDGSFVIENYNSAPTFSSFFPGIAGIFGSPMWVFYTNRGQCITSAGVEDKNGAIIEFNAANKAYRTVSLQGFRTFIKVDGKYYEPFSERNQNKREMFIYPDSLKIVERNSPLKIEIEITYFTVPNEAFPALARIVKITNLSAKARKIEVIDGLPIVIPFGFNNSLLKMISQTIEAWCVVENIEKNAPFYKLKVMPADASETKYIEQGNFFVSFANIKGKDVSSDIIINRTSIFGQNTSLELPISFIDSKNFLPPKNQQTEGITPAAFSYNKASLPGKGSFEICSILGRAENLQSLNKIKKRVTNRKYLGGKLAENRGLIDSICDSIHSQTAAHNFDLYSKTTFLDNVMRGGLPVKAGKNTLYVYYRKHGDMERDYNDFKLMPTYFSQGNGNYRDVNQNRRNDLFFFPEINDKNIIRFYNLIQLDGYNPLVVIGSKFYLKSKEDAKGLLDTHVKEIKDGWAKIMSNPFILGILLKEMEKRDVEWKTSREEFINDLLAKVEIEEGASHGEGFWTDHFAYNTDLLESFEGIYPEKVKELFFDKKIFTFFDNDHVVVDRKEKYRLVGGNVRQYESVKLDNEKNRLIVGRETHPNLARKEQGKGEIYRTTLIAKILCIVASKAASFDAEGIGLEMEAEKPDWYDALNGLPGLLGSSLSETLELKRLCAFTLKYLGHENEIQLPIELLDFIEGLKGSITSNDSFAYWKTAYDLKETYRNKTRLGIGGEEKPLSSSAATEFLNNVVTKCDLAAKKVLEKYNNYYTYFINEVEDFELSTSKEIIIKKFNQKPLPLFLEGFVHALKVEKDKNIPKMVKQSPLYDKKLKMYKVNSSLNNTSMEIGRARVFTPGWLENESIWLHMEYKYILELLKAGMHKEFFGDFKNVLVPYMDANQYKRSTLENSSFIVSSANPNKENHGRGFIARLSGGAAEFIDMWIIMMAGKKLFSLDEKGQLIFKLTPTLPAWLFKNGELSFKLLSTIDVTYKNPKKKNTFDGGVSPISYKLTLDTDEEVEISSPIIHEPHASQIRERKVKKIVVLLS
ncbi:MAG: cellobiose phosphorylase [Candidatus Margulisiibacteriota bacterium]